MVVGVEVVVVGLVLVMVVVVVVFKPIAKSQTSQKGASDT